MESVKKPLSLQWCPGIVPLRLISNEREEIQARFYSLKNTKH